MNYVLLKCLDSVILQTDGDASHVAVTDPSEEQLQDPHFSATCVACLPKLCPAPTTKVYCVDVHLSPLNPDRATDVKTV